MNWIDNADSYICPVCGFETDNPNKFRAKCPVCGFIADKEKESAEKKVFRKGDIVMNRFAGKGNPTRFLLYLGKSTITQGRYRSKGYDCLGYHGEKVQLFRENDPLVYIGHMDEFDAFVEALKRLGACNVAFLIEMEAKERGVENAPDVG